MKAPYSLVPQSSEEKDGVTHETFHVMDGESSLGMLQVAHAGGKVRGFKTQGLKSQHMSGVLGALGQRFKKAMPTLAGAIQQMSGALPKGGMKMPTPKGSTPNAAPGAAPALNPTKSLDPEKRRVMDAMAAQGAKPPKPPTGNTPAAMAAPAPMGKALGWQPVQGDIDRWNTLKTAVTAASDYMKTADLKHGAVPFMQISLRDADHHLDHARQYMELPADKPTALRTGMGGKEPHLRHMDQLEESLRLWQGHANDHAKFYGATAPNLGIPDAPSIAAKVGAGVKNVARNALAAVRPKPSAGSPAATAAAASSPSTGPSALNRLKSRVASFAARGNMSAPVAAAPTAASTTAPAAAPAAASVAPVASSQRGSGTGRSSRRSRPANNP